jgi:hypothetical protein
LLLPNALSVILSSLSCQMSPPSIKVMYKKLKIIPSEKEKDRPAIRFNFQSKPHWIKQGTRVTSRLPFITSICWLFPLSPLVRLPFFPSTLLHQPTFLTRTLPPTPTPATRQTLSCWKHGHIKDTPGLQN